MSDVIDGEIVMEEGSTALTRTQQDPGALLMKAVEGGMSVEVIERLVALQERAQERNARAAFFEAMTAFRAECPAIPRTRENTQFDVTRNGVKVKSRYAALEDIDRIARPVAARHGLAWTWNTAVAGDLMVVSCRVSHVDGHSEETSVTMPTESKAGSSLQQKFGSAQTYGMRYSLVAALGLTTADEDTDGAGRRGEHTVATASKQEVADMAALVAEVGANLPRFLAFMGVERLEDIPASSVPIAISTLEKKRGGGA
jgi:hypothetical protein